MSEKFDQLKIMQKLLPNATFVDINGERVADTSKTIYLTEQWKKGELKEGWYYITNKAHSIKFNQMALYIVYGETKYWRECKDEDIEEVLAPVPSWEEYLESESHCAVYSYINKWLKEENNKLKELLKECREVAEFTKTIVNKHKWFNDVIAKIDEVLK